MTGKKEEHSYRPLKQNKVTTNKKAQVSVVYSVRNTVISYRRPKSIINSTMKCHIFTFSCKTGIQARRCRDFP